MSQRVEERYVNGAGDTRIFVREGGSRHGYPNLMLHGYLFSSTVFQRQFQGPLAEQHRLVAMDLRGHGRSDKPSEVAAYDNARIWAEDVAAVVEALGLERPIIVGWSLGSRVALNYSWFHGFDRIGGLNLVAAVVDRPSRGPLAPLPSHLLGLISPDENELQTTRVFIRDCAVKDSLTAQQEALFNAEANGVPVAARVGSRQWNIHYVPVLPSLQVPLLVTHGRGDSLVPERASRELAHRVPNGELSIIEGGHLCFFFNPAVFNKDLAQFAAAQSRSRGVIA